MKTARIGAVRSSLLNSGRNNALKMALKLQSCCLHPAQQENRSRVALMLTHVY